MNRGEALDIPKWYAVHTGAGQESLAVTKLGQAGFWTFHAFDRVRRRRKRPGTNLHVVEWINRPYFARYIFVALRFDNESIQAIEECDGVSCVVRKRLSGEPLEIPEHEMDRITDSAMVNFDRDDGEQFTPTDARSQYASLMREIVLDPEKVVTLSVDKRRKRILDWVAVAS